MKDSNRQIKATIRQRKAAHKAWKTIRQNNRLAAGRGSKTILEFVKPETVTTLRHPEIKPIVGKEELTSFGKGIVSLFHKTPEDIVGDSGNSVGHSGAHLTAIIVIFEGLGRMKPSPKPHYLAALDEAFENIGTINIQQR